MDAEPVGEQCPTCGAARPAAARFCAQCGSPLDGGDTARVEVPAPDPDEVPTAYGRRERRLFGVAPPTPLLGLAALAFICALVLFALGAWVAGLIALVVLAVLLFLFVGAAQKLPRDPVAAHGLAAAERAQALAGFARVSIGSWSRAGATAVRLRAEQRRLRGEQAEAIRALGEAAYREDEAAVVALRAQARTLAERIAQCDSELQQALAAAGERIGQERLAIQPTQVLANESAPHAANHREQ